MSKNRKLQINFVNVIAAITLLMATVLSFSWYFDHLAIANVENQKGSESNE